MLLKVVDIIADVVGMSEQQKKDINPSTNLRYDLSMDSLMLAALTVGIEDAYDIDIFEDGNPETVKDILERLQK